MSYLTEARREWRPLLAATVGLAAGLGVAMYTTNIFASALIKDFGWSKAAFAIISTVSAIVVLGVPVAGRLADVLGVRRTALIGVCALPVSYFAYSAMTGDIRQYVIIYFIQAGLCMTTTGAVYNRTLVQYFKNSRGLALAIGASGPAIAGVIGSPILNHFVETHGWRAGYHAMMIFSIVFGGLAVVMLPPDRPDAPKVAQQRPPRTREDYALIVKRSAFWIFFAAMFLCSLPNPVMIFQLKLVLIDRGITPEATGFMLSAWATGVLLGRFASGLAVDRFPAKLVAALGMMFLFAGLIIVATTFNFAMLLTVGAFLMGVSFGAEGGVIAYLIAQHFGVRLFGSISGLVTGAGSLATAAGGFLLSFLLSQTESYTSYLMICAGGALLGVVLLLLLGKEQGSI